VRVLIVYKLLFFTFLGKAQSAQSLSPSPTFREKQCKIINIFSHGKIMRLILCNILQNIFPDKIKAAFSRSPSLIFIITVFGKKLTVPYLMQFYLAHPCFPASRRRSEYS